MAARGRPEQPFLDQNQDSAHPEDLRPAAALTPAQAREGVCGKRVAKGIIPVSPRPSALAHERRLVLTSSPSPLSPPGTWGGTTGPGRGRGWGGQMQSFLCLQICPSPVGPVRGGGQAGAGRRTRLEEKMGPKTDTAGPTWASRPVFKDTPCPQPAAPPPKAFASRASSPPREAC